MNSQTMKGPSPTHALHARLGLRLRLRLGSGLPGGDLLSADHTFIIRNGIIWSDGFNILWSDIRVG